MLRHTAVAAATLALVIPAAASAAPRPRDLWATINVCDTEAHPNAMGVRARMPGNGTRQQMYMRFRAQFFTDQASWEDVGGDGMSRWIRVGSARFRHREAGFTFMFDPPSDGGRFVLRGTVDFQWRERRWVGRRVRRVRRGDRIRRVVVKRGRLRTFVVRRARAHTKGGFESTAGADPPGYSSGLCEIR